MEWVIIVDDDTTNLKVAGHVLSKNGIRVTALRSGKALLDFLQQNLSPAPNLILLDIYMQEMDGFETLTRLNKLIEGKAEIPVIFLSADQEQEAESRSLQLGAMDYIRKPFIPEILVSRVKNALRTQEKLQYFEREATIDSMTGFLNKSTMEEKIREICRVETGFLCVLDLDSFKLINDLHGHDMGDRVLIQFSDLLKSNMRTDDICGRIGGDEFLVFAKNMKTEKELYHFTKRINDDYVLMLQNLFGGQLKFPAGVSIGAASVPTNGRDYEKLFHFADQTLSTVKQNGKHNCAIYGNVQNSIKTTSEEMTLDVVTRILEERNISSNAMWMGKEAFTNIYRYMVRYMERYHGVAYRVLLTAHITEETVSREERNDIMTQFRLTIQASLRNSDLMVEVSESQIFLLLPETHKSDIGVVINRLIQRWNSGDYHDRAVITWETGEVHSSEHDIGEEKKKTEKREDWVAVVDDDNSTLIFVRSILSKQGMRVTALHSGSELIEFVKSNVPDLILLDIMMPEMDGFETLARLKKVTGKDKSIPVIFVTGDETQEAEKTGLQLGAEDFIKKPFIADILTLRVRNTIDRVRLQRNLAYEVAVKTEENQKLYMNVVSALAKAIDAKNTYTNGHSDRVAAYAREIAKRAGYSEKRQNELYMMALLHDVGKIGIPNAIINKPDKLTQQEYEQIKTHASAGAQILQTINEMPSLTIGARWHHERYGGGGYPDNLSGENIPEEARIIAVADAYDAMSSHRSYRENLPQEKIRGEIERGSGTQFDPRFAEIMLAMIDEDRDFQMREQ